MPDTAPAESNARSCLRWQVDMGASEGIQDQPVNRLALDPARQRTSRATPPPATGAALSPPQHAAIAPARVPPEPLPAATTSATSVRSIAARCNTLQALEEAIRAHDGCPLKGGATNTVIADGNPNAPLMVIGEAPGFEEDQQGLPFVGRAGQLIDRALSHIGLARDAAADDAAFYITNVVYWRPPSNRNPAPDEIDPLLPFCERHIELVQPRLLLLLGNIACQSLLRTSTGITRLRGNWKRWTPSTGGDSVMAMPSFHPAYLLRNPLSKQLFWHDLLALRARLDGEDGDD